MGGGKRGLWVVGRGGLCAGGGVGWRLWVNGVGGGECTVSRDVLVNGAVWGVGTVCFNSLDM